MSRAIAALVVALLLALASSRPALGQGNPPGTTTVSAAITGIHQFAADLDQGGDVEWSSVTLSAGVTRQFVPAFWAGLSLSDADEDWHIRSATAFGGRAPWEHLHRPATSLNLNLALSPTFVIGVSPTFEWAYDSHANVGDALIYGAVLSATRVWSPKFVLGLGASVTRQFYSVKTSPFVIVNWKLSEKLKIANAVPAGPEGGAGVELRYAPAPVWEMAVGGVSRSGRWKLQDQGPGTPGVGEQDYIPLFGRLGRKLGAKAKLDVYGGAFVNGKLRVRDSDGHELAHDDYATTPAIAATLSAKF